MNSSQPVVIIDGNNLAHRMYHQPILQTLRRADGKASGMFYGTIHAVQRLVVRFRPCQILVVFDGPGSGAYKVARKPLTGSFRRQLKAIKFCLAALGIPVLEREEVEADDLIFQLSRLTVESVQRTAVIVTSDRDLLQCITPQVLVYDDQRKRLWTEASVRAEYQLTPAELPLLKALEGKSGVRGVPGIGRVRGTELIHRYRTAEKIRQHLTEDQQETFMQALAVVQFHDEPVLRELARLHLESTKPLQADLARMTIAQYNCPLITRRFEAWAAPFHHLVTGRIQRKVHHGKAP